MTSPSAGSSQAGATHIGECRPPEILFATQWTPPAMSGGRARNVPRGCQTSQVRALPVSMVTRPPRRSDSHLPERGAHVLPAPPFLTRRSHRWNVPDSACSPGAPEPVLPVAVGCLHPRWSLRPGGTPTKDRGQPNSSLTRSYVSPSGRFVPASSSRYWRTLTPTSHDARATLRPLRCRSRLSIVANIATGLP